MKFLIITTLFLISVCFVKAQDAQFIEGLKAFDSKDFKKAAELLQPYAESGSCLAQYVNGYYYSQKELGAQNDSLAEKYLKGASEKKQTHAMGLLAAFYFGKGLEYKIQALVWAEIAAEFDIIQKGLTTRRLIRMYMSEEEITEAEKMISEKKKYFHDISACNE
jgi:TPR repeat protein